VGGGVDRSRGDAAGSLLALFAGGIPSALWAVLLVVATRRRPERRLAIAGGLALVAVTAVEVLLKVGLHHPGPPGPPRTLVVWGLGAGPSLGGSYPSGHACRAIVLAATTAMVVRRRWVTVLLAGWVAVVIATRVYLGEHWTSDVLGGVVLGLVGACALRVGWWGAAGLDAPRAFAVRVGRRGATALDVTGDVIGDVTRDATGDATGEGASSRGRRACRRARPAPSSRSENVHPAVAEADAVAPAAVDESR
jgi:membrane-associated phospholipid phosphatase